MEKGYYWWREGERDEEGRGEREGEKKKEAGRG